MRNFYEIFNVTSDMQLENLMEKLDLTTDEMIYLSSISDNVMLSLNDKRKRVMEMMSSNLHNYNIMKTQYLKPTNRIMKENDNDTNVNMNDIIELNDFIQSVYKKCSTDKKALKRIYDYLMKHTSKNITKEILTIIRNASSNDELKINPSVVVDGQKITDILMSIKNDIDNIIKTSSNLDLDENKNFLNKETRIYETLLIEGIADVAKYFPKLDIETIKEVIKLDPTYNGGDQLGKYGKWILKLVYNNVKNNESRQNFQNLMKQYPDGINPKNGQPFQAPKLLPDITNEDRYKLTQSLKKYDMFKEEIGRAIDSFKTLPELDAAISEVEERGDPAEKLARQRLGIFKNAMSKGLKKVYEDGKWIVGIPETHESSKMFGDETSWCTTSNGSYYDHYSSQGPLFINLNKDNGRLYQFHFQSESFMDEHDSTYSWEDGDDIDGFFQENPFLEHFYKDYVRHEEDPKKMVESIVNNRDRLNDIFDDVYNLAFDGKHITGTMDVKHIDPIYRDRDTVPLSFISNMLSGDWWDVFNGGDYDVGYDELDYSDSAFDSEIKKISKEGGIDLTKIKWSEIMEILRTDGSEETKNFTEEEAEKLYDKMTNDFSDDMSIWSVFSDCKRNGTANEAYNDIKSDLINNLPLNLEEPFNNSDLNICIPFEDLIDMCSISANKIDIESDTTWYDRLYANIDFSNGWLYAWYSAKNSTDSFGIYEPNYGWDGFDESQWRYAVSNFVHYIHTMKRGKNKNSYSVNENINGRNTTNLGNRYKKKKKFNHTEEVDETCSSGSTCAGSVGMIGKPFKVDKKMNVSETVFLNMILDNQDVSQNIKGDNYRFTNGYLYKNGNIVKTKNRQKMVEFVLGNIDLPTLEGVLPMHLDILMEDEEETVNYDDLTPEQKEEKKKREDELSQKMSGNMEVDVSVENKDDSMKIDSNQKLIGVDDSDEKNKKYIIKNPSNNEIRLVDSSKIKMENYRGKYVRK